MAPMFGRNPRELSLIYNTMDNLIYDNNNHRLTDWKQPMLAPDQLQLYANAIHENGAVYRIVRPKTNQREVYNGHEGYMD